MKTLTICAAEFSELDLTAMERAIADYRLCHGDECSSDVLIAGILSTYGLAFAPNGAMLTPHLISLANED